jgi:glycosyltransferase involved in cell wall biosynthesis
MTVGLQKFRKVSIIIVSLNTKYFFLKTVNSVLAQSYKEREIIVVDGNSTDGTIDIIKKMKKKFSKVIIEKDRGIYDAMNKGSRLVSGEWVIFLNSGDVFYNKNTLSDIFKQSITKKDIIYGNTLVKNKNINYLVDASFFSKKTILMQFCHQSTMVKADIVKKNKFSLKYKYSSDFDFFIKCFSRKKIFYNSNLTIAKVIANGVSDNNRQKVYSENIKILKKYNYNFFTILKLWLFKLSNLIKDYIKYILPKFLILLILKFKYRKKILK